jgi:polysaccharide biosynthesis/export protein
MQRSVSTLLSCLLCWIAWIGLLCAAGCQTVPHAQAVHSAEARAAARMPVQPAVPRELCKVVLPSYVIEPPDILLIDAIHIVPKSPYSLRTMDMLAIQVQGTLPDAPISGIYPVEPGGLVRLGPRYGSIKVAGMTVEEAEKAITKHLEKDLKEPIVSATLADTTAKQQVAGQHLVGPDGTVTLGSYGSVLVVGMTVAQAKKAVEEHLSNVLENPEISLDVYAYNSKVYYIVTQGAGLGDGVYRFPVTGNETVLDAISQINGLHSVSSKKIWIARPTDDPCRVQVLPVCWDEITAQASAGSNYQILPGDRVFVAQDSLVAFDNSVAKITAPLQRIMGFSLLGVGTVTRFSGHVLEGGGNPSGGF